MTPYERAQRRWRVAYFLRAAERCGGNCGAAARLIGVHRNTFTRVLQQAGYTAKEVRSLVNYYAEAKPPSTVTADEMARRIA